MTEREPMKECLEVAEPIWFPTGAAATRFAALLEDAIRAVVQAEMGESAKALDAEQSAHAETSAELEGWRASRRAEATRWGNAYASLRGELTAEQSAHAETRAELGQVRASLADSLLRPPRQLLNETRAELERVKGELEALTNADFLKYHMKAKVYGELAYKWRKRCIEAGSATEEDRILADEWQGYERNRAELEKVKGELAECSKGYAARDEELQELDDVVAELGGNVGMGPEAFIRKLHAQLAMRTETARVLMQQKQCTQCLAKLQPEQSASDWDTFLAARRKFIVAWRNDGHSFADIVDAVNLTCAGHAEAIWATRNAPDSAAELRSQQTEQPAYTAEQRAADAATVRGYLRPSARPAREALDRLAAAPQTLCLGCGKPYVYQDHDPRCSACVESGTGPEPTVTRWRCHGCFCKFQTQSLYDNHDCAADAPQVETVK